MWSISGDGYRPAVNQFLLQYFITYQLKKGWYITPQPIITANWKASSGNVWTIPLGVGVGRVMRVGAQPIEITSQFYGNAVYPNGASSWSWRLQIALLFPKLTKTQQKMLLEQKLKQLEESPAKQ